MPKLNVLNIQGQNVGEIELSDAVFGVEVNEHVLYEVVKNQLANKRQGTQSAKTRAEVKSCTMDRWRSCFRTKTKKLQIHITKES